MTFGVALLFLRRFAIAVAFAFAAMLAASGQETSSARIAQQMLVERGYAIGAVDGIWGPRSATAMKELQRELGLPQTGLPDAATLEALGSTSSAIQAVAPQPQVPQQREAEPEPDPEPVPPANEAVGEPKTMATPTIQGDSISTESDAPVTPPVRSAGKVEVFPFLLGLGIVTAIAALGIYLFFSAAERRRFRLLARGPDLEVDTLSPPEPSTGIISQSNHVPKAQLATNLARAPLTASPEPGRREQSTMAPLRASPSANPSSAQSSTGGARSSPWVPGQEVVSVGNYRLRGFIYVGESLKPQNGWGQRDNCLVIPSLPVAARADVSGQYLDYWPSYERLSPSSRKAYLDWLASDRSNPETPIGYVFLYFYGLERRLMLERDAFEKDAVVAEVERLVGLYGSNNSFRRYSAELLSAARALEGGAVHGDWRPIGLGDVPISDRLELGRRAATGQSIPPALLLSLVANHPETRLRAPVRRLPELIAQRFASRVERDYPEGLVLGLPRQVPKLEVTYRAASSTFEVPVIGTEQAVPDLAQLTEPLTYGRSVLEAVTDELESYSRELGKASGSPATIAGLSKLPPDLRHERAMAIAGDAMAKLNAVADSRQVYRLSDLLSLVGLKTDVSTKIGLRALSQCLAGWGIGIVPDPQFAPKILADRDGVLVFRLDMTEPVGTEPSDQYRLTYVSLALGVVIASSDGSVSDVERRILSRLILDTPGLSEQEQRRLVADFRWLEASPLAVSDLRQFLKESTPEFRTTLMNSLLPIAAADGKTDAGEVQVLEKVAKALGLDTSIIYQALHRIAPDGDDLSTVEAPRQGVGHAIPTSKRASGSGVDATRLAAIRAETAHASGLLQEIFADDEGEAANAETAVPPTSLDGELDQRHRVLLGELVTRPQWSEEDFERLVRQAGLMPHGARTKINDWAIERFDELILEGDRTIVVNRSVVLEAV